MNGTMWWLIGVFFAAQWNDSDCVYGMPDCYCFKTCRISAYAATSKFDISFVICVHMEQTAGVLVTFCYCKKMSEWVDKFYDMVETATYILLTAKRSEWVVFISQQFLFDS
jgi:hypothetical protein